MSATLRYSAPDPESNASLQRHSGLDPESSNKPLRQLLAEFDEIVTWFDGDDIDIEQAIAKYEQGAELAGQIKKQLNDAKNKIKVIKP